MRLNQLWWVVLLVLIVVAAVARQGEGVPGAQWLCPYSGAGSFPKCVETQENG